METGLAGYDAACAGIASAKNVDEVKQIHDKAEAVRAYARQAKNKTLEIDAAEIRIRAERRLGELLAVMPKATGAKGIGNPKSALVKREHTATLKQMGVSMDLSARAQRLAAVPAEAFEEKISEWRGLVEEENERVTTNLLKIGEESQKHVRGTFGTSENEWYTPSEYVELARRVLGEIDLDPASSDEAQTTIKAKVYFSITVLHTGDITAEKSSALFNVALGEVFCSTQCLEPFTDVHRSEEHTSELQSR